MGRPRKHGARHPFITRIPVELANEVMSEADSRGLSYSEYIALRVAQSHGEQVELPPKKKPTPKQEALEISA